MDLSCLIKLLRTYLESSQAGPENYNWRINHARLPNGVFIPDTCNYSQNVRLKYALHEAWLEARRRNDDNRLIELANYYVATWGGVRGNSEATILGYIRSDPQELIQTQGGRGVASWSKVLCITNPECFAIFDARVAMALNALQAVNRVSADHFVRFPILPSRNTMINRGNAAFRKWFEENDVHNAANFYGIYLNLLKVAAGQSLKICEVEMRLFGGAVSLCQEALTNILV
jgi:hypothetical protein